MDYQTKYKYHTSMVVVLAATSDMCIIRNPITLKANAKFNTVKHREIMRQIKCYATGIGKGCWGWEDVVAWRRSI